MLARVLTAACLTLSLFPAPSEAQTWMRSEGDEASDLRLLARPDGLLIDLTEEDWNAIARLRTMDHEGESRTAVRLETLFGGTTESKDAALLPGGDVVVVGTHLMPILPTETKDPWVGRFDPETGASAWIQKLPLADATYTRVLVSDDAVYAIGQMFTFTSMLVSKFDHDGNHVWNRRVGLANQDDRLVDVSLAPQGGVLLLMRDPSSNSHLIQVSENGSIDWHNYYDTFNGAEVVATTTGEIWVAGVRAFEIAVLALDASGKRLWSKEYLGYKGDIEELLPKAGGGAAMCVTRLLGSEDRPSLMTLNATGEVEWSRMYDVGNAYPYQSIREAVDVGERGWVLDTRVNDYKHLLAVLPDGTASLPCVPVTDLATLVQPVTIRSDEPPATELFVINTAPVTWILQPIPEANPIALDCGNPCSTTMATWGIGLAGSGLVTPELSGTAGACAGTPHPRLEVKKGLGGTFGVFGYSLSPTALSVFGGTLYLDPQNFDLELINLDGPTGIAGTGTWSFEVTTNLLSHMGGTLQAQVILRDAGAPQGWSFSNALEITID